MLLRSTRRQGRRWIAAVVGGIVALGVVAALYYNIGSSAALSDQCSATPPDASVARLEASSITVGWSIWPVGLDCIFTDANGQVLAREYVGFWP